ITIDVSPPHEGYVHDGIRGDPELDYQQDLHVDAHWEGFFDRESGVEFYQYIFSDHCMTSLEFKNSNETTETYNAFASFEAPVEGTYFVSVVAVNRAKESSKVVCSDGVIIMPTVPSVKDFVLEGARTRSRLLRDNNGTVWLLDNILRRHRIENISSSCKVSSAENITVFPLGKPIKQNGEKLCGVINNLHILAAVRKESQLKMSWRSDIGDALMHDYEIGLSSTASSSAPDIVPFRSTKHHFRFRLNHPDVPDGKEFFVIIKSISKAAVEGLQSIGPFIVDTTKPQFSGVKIDVNLKDEFLIANWTTNAFEDPDDPYPMHFQYAVGHRPNTYDIQHFRDLLFTGKCKRTIPATCTALPVSSLKWSLHGHHNYYFTIKATNLAGLSVMKTSVTYTHDVQLPAKGIVIDVPMMINQSAQANKDIEDIDFSTDKTSLAVSWTGFAHPHESVNFSGCVGTLPKMCDVSAMTVFTESPSFSFKGLTLIPFQMYYVTVEARTRGGSVKVNSDGVRVLDINQNLTGINVWDGINCTDASDLDNSHHSQDTRPKCKEDIAFQTSTSTLNVYWTIPAVYNDYVRDAFVRLEERLVGDVWMAFQPYTYVGKHRHETLTELNLKPGKSYRAVVKFCAEDICFPPVYGTGVTIISSPPSTGDIIVQIKDSIKHQLIVTFEKMFDPDIEDHAEAKSVVYFYEWALGDNVGVHTVWNAIDNGITLDTDHMQFIIPLNTSLDFSKCRKLNIRGYNKAGVWSTISKEIKTCYVQDGNSLIIPNMVIDAVGRQEKTIDGNKHDGYGRDIYLEENGRWEETDVDYTPYKNIISATWPLLRHKNYTWAVIDAETLDVTSYYKDEDMLQLKDPCSHPNTIKCGVTNKEYVNVIFDSNRELEHGKRYIMCIYAPRKEIQYEKWTEVLDEIKSCSDGVTVDLTPPTPGHVWIGIDPKEEYQSSTTDIFVSWDSFTDVEEYRKTAHASGIKEYELGI
ncbi:Hypothetical predicted protein, partial [Mytilus galloprovincialis]